MENNTFKSVTFGGFAKQDVIDYIEKTARENAEVQEHLQQENDALRNTNEDLDQQLAELRTRLDVAEIEVEHLRGELAGQCTDKAELEKAQEESRRLSGEVERLRPDAEAYALFREQLGAIECEARERAAELERETVARMERLTALFRTRYQALTTTFATVASHVTGELRKVEVELTQLPRAMDQGGTELDELENALQNAVKTEHKA